MPGLFWTLLLIVCVVVDAVFIAPFRKER